MTKINLIGILIILGTLCCSNTVQILFKSNSITYECFDTNEIEELSHLVSHYDSILSNRFGGNTIDTVYHNYLNTFKLKEVEYSIFQLIERDKDIFCYFNFIKNDISVYNELWTIYISYDSIKETTLSSLDINMSGKYMCFLSKHAKQDKLIQKYFKSIQEWNAIPPISRYDLIYEHDQFDLSDPDMRLIYIVNLIIIHSDLYLE